MILQHGKLTSKNHKKINTFDGIKIKTSGRLPWPSSVKTLHFQSRGSGSDPWLETKVPQLHGVAKDKF